jgi:hypothetical protein
LSSPGSSQVGNYSSCAAWRPAGAFQKHCFPQCYETVNALSSPFQFSAVFSLFGEWKTCKDDLILGHAFRGADNDLPTLGKRLRMCTITRARAGGTMAHAPSSPPKSNNPGRTIMNTITSALLALALLAGFAGQLRADENDGKSINLEQMDRESRGGQGN